MPALAAGIHLVITAGEETGSLGAHYLDFDRLDRILNGMNLG
jgi:hypothetical protein